jgi:hypothetical protein
MAAFVPQHGAPTTDIPLSPGLRDELDEYRERVAELAYQRAEQRGFIPGHEVEDWLEAERAVAEYLAKRH